MRDQPGPGRALPAMTKPRTLKTRKRGLVLTGKRATFVRIYVETGEATAAVIQAGYKVADPSTYGARLKRELAEIIAEEVSTRLADLEPAALKVIADLMLNAESENVRLKAAQDILDRGDNLRGARTVSERIKADDEPGLWADLVQRMGEERARLFMGPDYIPPPDREQIIDITPDPAPSLPN